MRHFVLVAVALAALAGAASAAAPVHVIQGDRNAGGIRIARSTPADVKQLFGPASSGRTSSASPQSCVRIWSALRLEVEFFSFESNPCLRGVALTVTVRSRAAWRTALGLRVGDSAARLRGSIPRHPCGRASPATAATGS
jgi:opacity protein-like surface antigen